MKTQYPQTKPQGFTLIEFLVASALAVVVILAAGSTYLITNKLKNSSQERIDVQNNLRNAATMITRDARVAGNFGCFTTGGIYTEGIQVKPANEGIFPDLSKAKIGNGVIRLDNDKPDGYGVILADNLPGINLPGAQQGKALVFLWGSGNVGVSNVGNNSLQLANTNDEEVLNAIKAGGDMILSSCKDAIHISPTGMGNNHSVNFKNTNLPSEMTNESLGLSVSKLSAAAYVIATVNGKNSLLRYDLQDNGQWQTSPQLLSANINSMSVSFAYEENCNIESEASGYVPVNHVNFVYRNKLEYRNLPSLIQIRLTYSGSSQSDYIINAGIRGAGQCASHVKMEQ